ncbi:MAG: hypothetical protein WCV86_05485 [Patescibacteria group bacterium]
MANQPAPSNKGGGVQKNAGVIVLVARLVFDKRVSFWLKLLPIGSLLYLILPDFMPGPLDDAAALWLLNYLFIELSPKDIVEELRNR